MIYRLADLALVLAGLPVPVVCKPPLSWACQPGGCFKGVSDS
jgi:hypothetical protein